MNGPEWTALAVAVIAAVGTVVLQALQMYLSYKRDMKLKEGVDTAATKAAVVEKKIDHNTIITREGNQAAALEAKVAADAASSAATKVDNITEQLNGKLENKITTIVKTHIEPVIEAMKEHNEQDDRNIKDMSSKIIDLTKYVHERNHDILTALQTQANKIETVIVTLNQKK